MGGAVLWRCVQFTDQLRALAAELPDPTSLLRRRAVRKFLRLAGQPALHWIPTDILPKSLVLCGIPYATIIETGLPDVPWNAK